MDSKNKNLAHSSPLKNGTIKNHNIDEKLLMSSLSNDTLKSNSA